MTVPGWTERVLLDRLRARHAKDSGNGPEWAYMEHVRSSAGADCLATIDALAMHLWRSRHHQVHAYEVKVSRSDFRRELENDCAKSAIWREWVDAFWIVAPPDVVPADELPDKWGLIVAHGSGLRVKRTAARLQSKPPGYMPAPDMPRDIVAPMLRAAVRTALREPLRETTECGCGSGAPADGGAEGTCECCSTCVKSQETAPIREAVDVA